MSQDEIPNVAIARQGGGSHAAFGAGVIYRLLQDYGKRYRLCALSGTSGGAINAVLTWSGLVFSGMVDGPEDARSRLKGMWTDIEANEVWDAVGNWCFQLSLNLPFSWEISPHVLDLGFEAKLRSLLEKWVKLDALSKDPSALNNPTLFVGATDICQGTSVAIRGDGETFTRVKQSSGPQSKPFSYMDVIASCAIPPFFKEVNDRSTLLWDGVFSTNPPIHVLTNLDPKPDQIWIVQINPQKSRHTPTTMRDIVDRRNELSGNLSLNKELEMIESVNKMLERKYLGEESGYRPIEVKIVSIEESDEDLHLTQASKFDRDPVLIQALFKRGEARGPDFYHEHSQRQLVMARVEAQPPSR